MNTLHNFCNNQIFHKSTRPIVHRYRKTRSPFDKSNYIDDWIERPYKFHRNRKPKMSLWDDPKVNWPPIMAAPSKKRDRSFLRELDEEEMERIKLTRNFEMGDFRPGDVINFHFLHSLSEGKGNLITAVCLGVTRKNTYKAGFYVMFNFGGMRCFGKIHHYSPMVAWFSIKTLGAGNCNYKMFYLWNMCTIGTVPIKPVLRRSGRRAMREGIKRKTGYAPNRLALKDDEYNDPL